MERKSRLWKEFKAEINRQEIGVNFSYTSISQALVKAKVLTKDNIDSLKIYLTFLEDQKYIHNYLGTKVYVLKYKVPDYLTTKKINNGGF